MTDLLMLANLMGGPLHGYALKKQVGLISGQGEMHNNLIYPLLRKFEKNGWITGRSTQGQRGQTRAVYSLTKKGKEELLRRLAQFDGKEARLENAFRLRVGMFAFLDAEARRRILSEREAWLTARQERIAHLGSTLKADRWGQAVLSCIANQIRSERKWIAQLRRRV